MSDGLITKHSNLRTSQDVAVAIRATTNIINKLSGKLEELEALMNTYLQRESVGVTIKVGDVVKNKSSGRYGTIHYSSFGLSVHTWDEDGQMLGKSLGAKAYEVQEYWEAVDLPKGYEILPYGGVKKIG